MLSNLEATGGFELKDQDVPSKKVPLASELRIGCRGQGWKQGTSWAAFVVTQMRVLVIRSWMYFEG